MPDRLFPTVAQGLVKVRTLSSDCSHHLLKTGLHRRWKAMAIGDPRLRHRARRAAYTAAGARPHAPTPASRLTRSQSAAFASLPCRVSTSYHTQILSVPVFRSNSRARNGRRAQCIRQLLRELPSGSTSPSSTRASSPLLRRSTPRSSRASPPCLFASGARAARPRPHSAPRRSSRCARATAAARAPRRTEAGGAAARARAQPPCHARVRPAPRRQARRGRHAARRRTRQARQCRAPKATRRRGR